MDKHKVKVDPPWRTPSGWRWSNAYLESIADWHVLKRPGEKPRERATYRQHPNKMDQGDSSTASHPTLRRTVD